MPVTPLPERAADDPWADLEEYAASALADLNTPGMAIAVVKNGRLVVAHGYGVRRAGGHEPVDEHTLFPIGSVTKVLTATCLAQQVDEGRLKWNGRVVDHFPDFKLHDPYLTSDIRVADLLSHRTGLERGDLLAYRGDFDRDEILRRLQFLQPLVPFRSRYGYHNLMVVAAGEVLERVADQSWSDYLLERVLQPLEMGATQIGPQRADRNDNVATAYALVDGRLIPDPLWEADAGEGFLHFHEAVGPAASVVSNVVDMARFLQMYLNEGTVDGRQLLQAATVREMFAPHSVLPLQTPPQPTFAYPRFFVGSGLGWQLRDYRGRKLVYHGGSSGAVVAMMPEENVGIVVLANRGSGVVYMVMHDLLDRLLGIPRSWTHHDWVVEAHERPQEEIRVRNERLEAERAAETEPSLLLREYVGFYECDLYGRLEISDNAGELRMHFGPNIEAALRHWEHDTFRGKLNFPPGDEWLFRFGVVDGRPRRLEVERLFWHEPMPTFERVALPVAAGD